MPGPRERGAERRTAPLTIVDAIAGIKPASVLDRANKGFGLREVTEKQVIHTLGRIRLRASELITHVQTHKALPNETELTLIESVKPRVNKAIQEEINKRVKPARTYSHNAFQTEKNGTISAVIQYKNCPELPTVTSKDGVEYAWYLRRTEPVGGNTVYMKVRKTRTEDTGNPWAQRNQPEQLVLRRKFSPEDGS